MSNSDRDLLIEASELVVTTQFGSTSMLQRKLGVTRAEAEQTMEIMESYGVVGPAKEFKTRDVRVSIGRLASTVDRLRREGGAP